MLRKIKTYIQKRPELWQSFRVLITKFRKIRFGLKYVDNTFFIHTPIQRINKDFKTGKYGLIGNYCYICEGVSFGNYVLVAPELAIIGGDHRFDISGIPVIFSGRPEMKETIIEDDVWIGRRVTIMSGIKIGRGAIIAAGSIVTKDISPFTIVAGVPAKTIRKRFNDEKDIQDHLRMLDSTPKMYGSYVKMNKTKKIIK